MTSFLSQLLKDYEDRLPLEEIFYAWAKNPKRLPVLETGLRQDHKEILRVVIREDVSMQFQTHASCDRDRLVWIHLYPHHDPKTEAFFGQFSLERGQPLCLETIIHRLPQIIFQDPWLRAVQGQLGVYGPQVEIHILQHHITFQDGLQSHTWPLMGLQHWRKLWPQQGLSPLNALHAVAFASRHEALEGAAFLEQHDFPMWFRNAKHPSS